MKTIYRAARYAALLALVSLLHMPRSVAEPTALSATTLPVQERFDAYPPDQLLSVENGSLETATADGGPVLRWHVNAGQTSHLDLRHDHPLFNRLRDYDLFQFEYRIVSGDIASLDVNAQGVVSGARRNKVHNWTIGVSTTPHGEWQSCNLEFAHPAWLVWDNPDGQGEDGFLRFEGLALTPDTVIELRNVRLTRALIYLKPDYEVPITWPEKTENPDGGVTYTISYPVLNASGRPISIQAKLLSAHRRFQVSFDHAELAVKNSEVAIFTLSATIGKADIDATPEMYDEPLRLSFAPADVPAAEWQWNGFLVRPMSKDLKRQVIVAAPDLSVIRAKLAGGDAQAKQFTQFDRITSAADQFLAIRLDHIPGGHNHVYNDIPGVPGDAGRALQPGSFMPEIVDAKTGFREADTLLAQQFWKEYLDWGGVFENLGKAYLLSGDEKYARKAVELASLYGRQYTELDWGSFFDPPWNQGPTMLSSSRIAATSSYGSNWYLKAFCEMLSMTADSPSWTAQAKRQVYEGFVRPYAAEIMKFPGGINNMTDITNHDVLLLGLVFDDANMVRWATRRDAGLLSRLSDIDDDGFSSEGRAINYAQAAMSEYLPTLGYLANSGLAVQYPKQRLLAALQMPYRRATLWGTVPLTGDGGRGGFRVDSTPLADSLLAIFPDQDWLFNIGTASTLGSQARALATAKQPDANTWKKLTETDPRLFPQAGLAILRSGDTPDTQIMLTLDYGRSLVHSALDRNQITLAAFGKMFAQGPGSLYNAGTGGITYNPDPRMHAFIGHGSLGQNVVMIDEQDQLPAIGKLLKWSPRPDRQVVVSRVDGLAPGVGHTRGLLLTQGIAVLFDRMTSDAEHTYDFVYHNFGKLELAPGWTAQAMDKPLGTTANYDNIADPAQLHGQGPLHLEWDLSGPASPNSAPAGPKLGFWQLAAPNGQFYTGYTGMNNLSTGVMADRTASVFQRVRANNADFVTVLEPYKTSPTVQSIEPARDGGVTIHLTNGKSLTVKLDDLLRD